MKHILSILFALCVALGAMAQQEKVPFNGVLLDLAGKPINKARVYVRTPKDYAMTNKQGEFGLTNVKPNDTLRIQVKKELYTLALNGMRSVRIHLGNQADIQGSEDDALIQEGFSFVPRRERTMPGNYISGKELRRTGQTDLLRALQGKVPGLSISTSGAPGGDSEVSLRGTRSIMMSSKPAFYVDHSLVDSFDGISVNDVDYIEVLKDGGPRGANGAIMVYTRGL